MSEELDLSVAKCVFGERTVSRRTYEKLIKDLINEVEKLRAGNAEIRLENHLCQDEIKELNNQLTLIMGAFIGRIKVRK